jgi:hypothetical protein
MVGPRQAGEMVKARAIDGPVSRWWGLPGCNGTNQPVSQRHVGVALHAAPLRLCRPPLPAPAARAARSSGQRAIGVGGPAGPVGSARQHVTRPHTHDAGDPRASSRPGPSLSPQSARGRGVHLSFFQFSTKKNNNNKNNRSIFHTPTPYSVDVVCTYKGWD